MSKYYIGYRDKRGHVQVKELKKVRNIIDLAKAEQRYGTGLITAETATGARQKAIVEMGVYETR